MIKQHAYLCLFKKLHISRLPLHLIFSIYLQLQTLDVAVSLAKVADVDRTMGNEDAALDRFREAIKLLGSLTLKPEEAGLEQRVGFLCDIVNYHNYLESRY